MCGCSQWEISIDRWPRIIYIYIQLPRYHASRNIVTMDTRDDATELVIYP